MPEVLALLALPLLAGGTAALRAVLDGRAARVPASIAVLAPASEAARALRTLPLLAAGGAAMRVAALVTIVVAVVRVLLLPLDGAPALVTPLGVGAFVLLDLVCWGAWWAVERHRRLPLHAVAVELPVLLALAGPAVAAGSLRADAIAAAQRDLPFAVQMPGALLVLVAVLGLLAPWSAPLRTPPRPAGLDGLLLRAARAVGLVSGLATASALLLGGGLVRTGAATVLLLVVVEVVARRLPVLRDGRGARAAVGVLLPLAALQLAVVVALALLARG